LQSEVFANRWLAVLVFERQVHLADWCVSDDMLIGNDRRYAKAWFFTSKVKEEPGASSDRAIIVACLDPDRCVRELF